jgi:hypothetical protein
MKGCFFDTRMKGNIELHEAAIGDNNKWNLKT